MRSSRQTSSLGLQTEQNSKNVEVLGGFSPLKRVMRVCNKFDNKHACKAAAARPRVEQTMAG